MLTWPIALWSIVWWAEHDREAVRRWVPLLLVAAAAIPRVNVWQGDVFVR